LFKGGVDVEFMMVLWSRNSMSATKS